MIRTLFWARDRSASTWYRITQPGRVLAKNDPELFAVIEAHDPAEKRDRLIESADVFVMGRRFGPEAVKFVDLAKSDGRKVIYDFDDDLFSVAPFNDAYRYFGVEEVTLTTPEGEEIELWRDGQAGFDIARNREQLQRLTYLCEAADGVVVTTAALAKVYEKYNDKVAVVPNCVDLSAWRPATIEREEIRIGWSGGSSHWPDLMEIKPVLKELWSDPDFARRCKLVVCGMGFPSVFGVVPSDRLEFHPWVDIEAHPYHQALLGLDIALIPLKEDRFNRGKSPIKWIEAAALKVPAVCSAVVPYVGVVDLSRDGYLAETEADWLTRIKRLVADGDLRRAMGEAARRKVEQVYDQRLYLSAWEEIIDWVCS